MSSTPTYHCDLGKVAAKLQRAALAAVEPRTAICQHVHREGDVLVTAERHYDLGDYERVFIIGAGKAAAPMAAAIVDLLRGYQSVGTVVTKYGHTTQETRRQCLAADIEIIEAGHPVPDENSVRGARAVADLAHQATERDLVICVISGGGSALLTLPVPGLTLTTLQALTDVLLRSGATINELNTVRKHCSLIKGGHLARLVAPATLVTFVLSDVVGDPLDVIASGPTVPDSTRTMDAQSVLERYGTPWGFEPPEGFRLSETPKHGDLAFERVQHVIVGSNRLAALAATEQARQLGFNSLLLSTYVEGEAREVARVAAALAKGIRANGDPVPAPACLVWGGETTVTVRGAGQGGRNQELALAVALALDGWSDVLVMALATDGTDGPTDAAGAIVTGNTVARAHTLGLDPLASLEANDSYPFFDSLGDLIRTGPTGTNVNDLLFILMGEASAG
jgi:glycerate 2-kinase